MATAQKPFAVITGASTGIGFELAKCFAQEGYDLLIAANDEYLEPAADSLRRMGCDVETVSADLSTIEGTAEFCDAVQSSGRAVEALALNAGVGVSGDFVRDTNLQDELNMINLNVVSPVYAAKKLIPAMVARGEGRVLITASIASVMPSPFLAVYGASKAFLHSFSEALRNELKDTGVTVTALMPDATDTMFFERAHMEDTKAGAGKKQDAETVARQGFEAMMKGKDHVLAGSLKVKIMGAMAEITPETLKAAQNRKLLEPGSARK
jgi:short-subunit dehydrogenase